LSRRRPLLASQRGMHRHIDSLIQMKSRKV
jgi:hypothetical protein